MDKVEVRLSNLMAFDARALGNWGCPPEYYPAALDLVALERQHPPVHELGELTHLLDLVERGGGSRAADQEVDPRLPMTTTEEVSP